MDGDRQTFSKVRRDGTLKVLSRKRSKRQPLTQLC